MAATLGMVAGILSVVQTIGNAASTASQNKKNCLELAERARNLSHVLPNFACAAANDEATARVLERLRDALGEALKLIKSCQGGIFSGKYSSKKAAELDSVDKAINNCIMDLNLISQARVHHSTATTNHTYAHISTPHHAQSYCHYPAPGATLNAQWAPHQPQGYYHYQTPYTAAPAPSGGSNLSSLYTLPTVNKIFQRVCDGFR